MQFSAIPGLNELKKQLIGAHNRGKIAHAQLFSGRPGTAVLPMALAYASYLMCENRTPHDSCGKCANCLRIKKLVHPDIHLHFPKISAAENKYEKVIGEALPAFRSFVNETPFGDLDGWIRKYGQENKNVLISREDSRQILKNVSMRSVEGSYKIVLIWYPELMNANAANAILKVLEEPPEKTIFLLVSYSYESLLATITSRTQLVSVPPHEEEEVRDYLLANDVDAEKATQTASISEGKIGVASQLANVESTHEYEDFQQWMLECWNGNFTGLVKRSEDFSKSGKALQKGTLSYALSLIRNAVIHTAGQNIPSLSEAESAFIQKFGDKLGMKRLESVYQLANEALLHLERNSNARITHLNLSMDIIRSLNN